MVPECAYEHQKSISSFHRILETEPISRGGVLLLSEVWKNNNRGGLLLSGHDGTCIASEHG